MYCESAPALKVTGLAFSSARASIAAPQERTARTAANPSTARRRLLRIISGSARGRCTGGGCGSDDGWGLPRSVPVNDSGASPVSSGGCGSPCFVLLRSVRSPRSVEPFGSRVTVGERYRRRVCGVLRGGWSLLRDGRGTAGDCRYPRDCGGVATGPSIERPTRSGGYTEGGPLGPVRKRHTGQLVTATCL